MIDLAEIQADARAHPIAYVTGYYGGRCVISPLALGQVLPVGTAIYTGPAYRIDAAAELAEAIRTVLPFVKDKRVYTRYPRKDGHILNLHIGEHLAKALAKYDAAKGGE